MWRYSGLMVMVLVFAACTQDEDRELGRLEQAITDCTSQANGQPCDDGNPCTFSGQCRQGACEPGSARPDGESCDDENPCTTGEVCQSGTCSGGTPVADSTPCTGPTPCDIGICNSGWCITNMDNECQGCSGTLCFDPINFECQVSWTAPDGFSCSDANTCTIDDACAAGACVGTVQPDGTACDDSDICTNPDACIGGTCVGANADGTPCDDNDRCTRNDQCTGGSCAGTPIADGQPCEDLSPCLTGEVCQSGTCSGGTPVADSTPCTGPTPCDIGICNSGWCNYNMGNECQRCSGTLCFDPINFECQVSWTAPDGFSCSDANTCTVDDACAAGACVGTVQPDGTACDDSDICTNPDACIGGTCVGANADGTPCDDNDRCTRNDQCTGGSCASTPIADGQPCEDLSPCLTGEVCQSGTCSGGTPVADSTPCTGPTPCDIGICNSGWCNYNMGNECQRCSGTLCFDPINFECQVSWTAPDGFSCSDANTCTINDACAAGACVGTVKPDGTACDDSNVCTNPDACVGGSCLSVPIDCSNLDDACNVGGCNLDNGQCERVPRLPGTPCGTCQECDGLGACVASPDGWSCDDGLYCTAGDTCTGGNCTGSARDCSAAGDQCNDGACNESTDSCEPQPKSDGTACDDGLYCTVQDVCTAGACAGQARDCSQAGDACHDGVCNEDNDTCEPQVKPDGTACDDGQFCTVQDVCTAGSCAGQARDCSSAGDQCNDGVCNEADDSCRAVPKADGTACDDGMYCTDPDVCSSGTCTGGARDCSAAGDACNDGLCNENTNSCQPVSKPDGTVCDDGQFCTVQDACTSGLCGGTSRDCSHVADDCSKGTCDEQQDACVRLPANEGSACDDTLFCTMDDTCAGGTCTGSARDCSVLDDDCNLGACEEGSKQCVRQPANPGGSCDDGLYCTVSDSCTAGACTGSPNPCGDSDTCTDDTCDEAADSCHHDLVPRPGDEGPPGDGTCSDSQDNDCDGLTDNQDPNCQSCTGDAGCDDQNPCTTDTCTASVCQNQPVSNGTACSSGRSCVVSETCTAGACGGGQPRDCSNLDRPCSLGICSESAGGCVAESLPDGTACDDGLFCTDLDTCSGGSCSSQPRDCTWASDACVDGVCNETTDTCTTAPKPDGTVCDDGRFCTVADACASGTCVGQARDCSQAGDACHQGICDEGQAACIPTLLPDGTACDDGRFCTEQDACLNGNCLGQDRDCSGYTGPCGVGWCDEDSDRCEVDARPNGTVCDDGLYCTVSDACTAGACTGQARDCSSLDGECVSGVCDEAAGACQGENRPAGTSCKDNHPCNGLETCDGQGACQAGQAPDCDDHDPCTIDTCQAPDGCVNAPVTDFTDGDGCCPTGGTSEQDSDCPPPEPGESGCGCGALYSSQGATSEASFGTFLTLLLGAWLVRKRRG